ncbi:hypothetical protein RchiOBHm_Chr3g0493671 [Rosa chinensis]|uniref:Uncharacterized protein n=1 Tax=Rosa chinensis TaxID=74649 RepID=A0A2P6RGU2_ROSCH|nr:hypothetical protein RchiOBHm_Chr3g0493671 [Rosa chinensis]
MLEIPRRSSSGSCLVIIYHLMHGKPNLNEKVCVNVMSLGCIKSN